MLFCEVIGELQRRFKLSGIKDIDAFVNKYNLNLENDNFFDIYRCMPAKSEKQARYFRLVRAVQKGDVPAKDVSKDLRKTAKSMSPKAVKDFTKLKELLKNLSESEFSSAKMQEVPNKTLDDVLRENSGVKFNKEELLTFQNKQNGFGGFGKANFVHKKSTNEIKANITSNESNKDYVFKKLVNNQNPGLYNYGCFIGITPSKQSDNPEDNKEKVVYMLSSIFDDDGGEEKNKILADFIDRINSYGL
jgi:hypothetical protein